MAKHRRYPVKKVKKIKAKDPLERMGRQVNTKRQKNRVPKNEELDNQSIPRKWLEIQEVAKEAAKPRTRSGNKKSKNKFYEMTAKMGFKKRPWEDEAMLVNRVIRSKNQAIDEEMIKVKSGAAGRDFKEIDADLKLLDEQERRKKLLKVAANEKRRKLKEKEERFRSSQLMKNADPDFDFHEDEEMPNESEGEEDDQKPAFDEDVQTQIVRKSTSDKFKRPQQELDPEYKRRLTSNEKGRLKKKESNAERSKYLMLNAREVIPFGETVNAPPKFSNGLLKRLDPSYGQVVQRDLLLNKMFQSGTTSNKPSHSDQTIDNTHSTGITEQDRLRTIQAYRQLKQNQNRR